MPAARPARVTAGDEGADEGAPWTAGAIDFPDGEVCPGYAGACSCFPGPPTARFKHPRERRASNGIP